MPNKAFAQKLFPSILSLGLGFALLAFSFDAKTAEGSTENRTYDWSDVHILLDELTDGNTYRGFKGKTKSLEDKWYCKERRYFWSLDWESTLEDIEIDFDPNFPDTTTLHLTFTDSSVRAQYYRRGGLGCTWNGSEGRLNVGSIKTSVTMMATPEGDFPEFDLESLVLDDMEFENVEILAASFFNPKFRKSSPEFAEFVETNLNLFIKGFIKSSLRKRVMKAINRKIEESIENALDEEEQRDNPDEPWQLP